MCTCVCYNTSSTLEAVLAEVSMNMRPCSLANASPSSFFTSLLDSRSLDTHNVGARSIRYAALHHIGSFLSGECVLPLVADEHDDHVGVGMLARVL